ncbi:hypothetical protein [Streptomyces sp. NPDC088755]|uniref:hypothetical protein n=1 Tax=Streptomyces sp. NPDC088755 TaxID=3365888 RepID=UPI0037FAB98A
MSTEDRVELPPEHAKNSTFFEFSGAIFSGAIATAWNVACVMQRDCGHQVFEGGIFSAIPALWKLCYDPLSTVASIPRNCRGNIYRHEEFRRI